MSTVITPTVGRVVWITARSLVGLVCLPALITHVHSDDCISAVAFSGLSNVEGLLPGGTLPLPSITYDESGEKVHGWRWMPYQKGQAAKTEGAEKSLAELRAALVTDWAGRIDGLEAGLTAIRDLLTQTIGSVHKLEDGLAALNLKQPASQRLPVTDGTPVVPPAAGEVIGKNADGSDVVATGGEAGPNPNP